MKYLVLFLFFIFSVSAFGQRTLIADKIRLSGDEVNRIVTDRELPNVTDEDLVRIVTGKQ